MVWDVLMSRGLCLKVDKIKSLIWWPVLTLLRNDMFPLRNSLYFKNYRLFQQINSPCCPSLVDVNWFDEHFGDFQKMLWLPRSKNLTQHNHVLEVLYRFVHRIDPATTDIKHLWRAIEKSCNTCRDLNFG